MSMILQNVNIQDFVVENYLMETSNNDHNSPMFINQLLKKVNYCWGKLNREKVRELVPPTKNGSGLHHTSNRKYLIRDKTLE